MSLNDTSSNDEDDDFYHWSDVLEEAMDYDHNEESDEQRLKRETYYAEQAEFRKAKEEVRIAAFRENMLQKFLSTRAHNAVDVIPSSSRSATSFSTKVPAKNPFSALVADSDSDDE
jgi:hypothetical protein